MEIELSRFKKENNILELKVVEEHKKLKAKEEEMIMERTRVSPANHRYHHHYHLTTHNCVSYFTGSRLL